MCTNTPSLKMHKNKNDVDCVTVCVRPRYELCSPGEVSSPDVTRRPKQRRNCTTIAAAATWESHTPPGIWETEMEELHTPAVNRFTYCSVNELNWRICDEAMRLVVSEDEAE